MGDPIFLKFVHCRMLRVVIVKSISKNAGLRMCVSYTKIRKSPPKVGDQQCWEVSNHTTNKKKTSQDIKSRNETTNLSATPSYLAPPSCITSLAFSSQSREFSGLKQLGQQPASKHQANGRPSALQGSRHCLSGRFSSFAIGLAYMSFACFVIYQGFLSCNSRCGQA